MRTIAPLTGLRFFAAAWVVLYHFRSDIKLLVPRSEPAWPLLDSGYAGVDVFFVLSGFIIAYNYLPGFSTLRPAPYGRFLWLRLARIYPVHLATVAFFLVALPVAANGALTAGGIGTAVQTGDFAAQLALVHAWGWDGNHAWNYPAWSISAEWVAYLLFPVAALGLTRVRGDGSALLGVAAGFAFNLAVFIALARAGLDGEVPTLRILGEFAAGCFLFLLWRSGFGAHWRHDLIAPVAFAAAIVATAAYEASYPGGAAAVVIAPIFGLGIYALAFERGWLACFLSWRPVTYGGEISYSLYMTHAVAQFVLWRQLPAADFTGESAGMRLALLLLYGAAIMVLAALVHQTIEQPGRDGMRRLLGMRRARSRATPEPAGTEAEPLPTRS